MKRIALIVALTMLAVVAGCTTVKPKSDQQAVYAAGGTLAVAFIAADTYQALNSCAKPAHTLPCSDAATVARIQDAKVKALAAKKAAEAVVNSPGYTADQFTKAELILQAALSFLTSITPPVN